MKNWSDVNKQLREALGLQITPLAISFSNDAPQGVPFHEGSMPDASQDGRTGRVPAGCVFWMDGSEKAFTTVPEDHYNCSVGSVTHGLKTLEEVMANEDVQKLVESEWVTPEEAMALPVIQERPNFITYAPLPQTPVDPDVILLRINGMQAMAIHDAFNDIEVAGKPQCHIIPMSKEQGKVAISTGCMLSRVRTGMSPSEMTCTLPAKKIEEILEKLKTRRKANSAVTAYANQDARRFS
ncbi:MAG TPA: DUF169 domain-containing protein [Nitrospiria bacterium]|jgi:uncharacterized protein (DUF169 family)